MRNRKRLTKKPSYIMCLLRALIVAWLITGVLYGGMYEFFNYKCRNIYKTLWQEIEDDVCEKTEDLLYADYGEEYNRALTRLNYSISKATVAGVYAEAETGKGVEAYPRDYSYLVYNDKGSGEEMVYGATPLYEGVMNDALCALVERKTDETFEHESEIRYVNSDPFIGALYTVIYKDRGLLREDIKVTNGTDKVGFISAYIDREEMTFWSKKATQLIDGHETEAYYRFGSQTPDGMDFISANEVDSPRIEIYKLPEGFENTDAASKKIISFEDDGREIKAGFIFPELPTLRDVFPVMVSETLLIAFIIGTVVAVIVSIIRYSNARNIYDLFEYRKKTTDAMAHDLKTPLAAMAGYAENLEENINPDKNPYYIGKIRENIDVMNHMVVEILNHAKSEDGTLTVTRGKVDVMEMMQEAVFAMKEISMQNNVTTDISGKSAVINTDGRLLRQTVDNLLSNAIKFAKSGSTIEIEVGDRDLTIRNEFEGEIKDVSRLKEAFVKENDARNKGGNGLGLSIADNNLKALGHKLVLTAIDGVFEAKIRF